MEPKAEPPTDAEPAAPTESAAAPISDITPPPATEAAAPQPETTSEAVVEAPPEDGTSAADPADKNDAPAEAPAHQPAPPKLPKAPGNGVSKVIIATLVIVVGLAILAVVAYLQSK